MATENDVLLPGISTLTRLVARVRDGATQRLFDTLYRLPSQAQRAALDRLLEVPPNGRVSELERWHTGPTKASGPGMVQALRLVGEILAAGLADVDLGAVPPRRVIELAGYGMAARAAQLKKHPAPRRLATLLATVGRLAAKTIDDALELLDLLMVTELLGNAHRVADKQHVRRHLHRYRDARTRRDHAETPGGGDIAAPSLPAPMRRPPVRVRKRRDSDAAAGVTLKSVLVGAGVARACWVNSCWRSAPLVTRARTSRVAPSSSIVACG